MRFRMKPRKIVVYTKWLIVGAALGIQIGYLALFGLMPQLLVGPVEAATGQDTAGCMSANECKQTMDKKPQCQQGQGCCIEDRCFIPDTSCPKSMITDKQGKCFAKSPPFQMTIAIGGKSTVFDIGEYMQTVYKTAAGLAALLATVMITIGGFQYLTAADSGRVSDAKKRIVDAVIGLIITLCAYLLLQTINPDLISMRMPRVPVVKRMVFLPCQLTEYCRSCGQPYGLSKAYVEAASDKSNKDASIAAKANMQNVCSAANVIDLSDTARAADIAANCYGKSCDCASGGDCKNSEYRCIKNAGGKAVTDECPKKPLMASDGKKSIDDIAKEGGGANIYACAKCIKEGETCAPNGENQRCCTGFCADGKCTGGEPGDPCCKTVAESMMCNNQCKSNICQTNWGNVCTNGDIGMPCANDKECKAGFKCQTHDKNMCASGKAFAPCGDDSECQRGFKCMDTSNWFGSTVGWILKGGGAIVGGVTGVLLGPVGVAGGGYAGYQLGARISSTMTNKMCIAENAKIVAGCTAAAGNCPEDQKYCVETGTANKNFCSTGELGAICMYNENCASGHCVDVNSKFFPAKFAICVSGEVGGRCNTDPDCNSKHCYKTNDGWSVCSSGGPFSPCNGADSDCNQGNSCKEKRCEPNDGCKPGG